MHWKLPLLLCIFLIGFSNCQDAGDSTAGPETTDAEADAGGAVAADTTDEGGDADAQTEAPPAQTEAPPAAVETAAEPTEAGASDGDSTTLTADVPAPEAEVVEDAASTAAPADSDPVVTTAEKQPTLPNVPGEAEEPATIIPVQTESTTVGLPEEAEATTEALEAQDGADEATTAGAEPTIPPTLNAPPGEQEGPGQAETTESGGQAETTAGEQPAMTTQAAITTTAAPETTTAPWTGEPCETPYVLNQVERHFTATVGNEPVDDRKMKKNWYRFEIEGSPAIITSQPIKPEQCGTQVPFHLNLKGKKLPEKDTNGTYEICSSVSSNYGLIRCAEPQDIVVQNCGDKYVYELTPLVWKASLKAHAGICVQKPGEIVSLRYLAISQEESDKLDVPVTSVDDVSKEQYEGIVTLELKYPDNKGDKTDTQLLRELDEKYRPLVARELNGLPKPTTAPDEPTTAAAGEKPVVAEKEEAVAGQPPPNEGAAAPEEKGRQPPNNLDTDADLKGPRAAPLVANPRFLYKRDLSRVKREASDHEYTEDDVHYVGPTPRIKHNVIQKSVYVDDPESTAVDVDRLYAAIKNAEKTGELGDEMNLTIIDIYKGLPKDIEPLVVPLASQSTWKKHEGVFITIIVLLLLLLLILLIGICCIKCRKRRGSWTANERPKNKGKKGKPSPSKRPLTAHESPLPDDEIKRDEANMTERENPAYTPNGSGGHIAKPDKDDEQGWIVPFEELNRAERMRPDVQDTRL